MTTCGLIAAGGPVVARFVLLFLRFVTLEFVFEDEFELLAEQPDVCACRSELRVALARVIERLPERQRVIVELGAQRGLAPAEIAAVLGLAVPTVWSHRARALPRLRRALARFRAPCTSCPGCDAT